MRSASILALGWLTLACRGPAATSASAFGAATDEPSAGVVKSNVTRADYAGSAACARCHRREHEAWQGSPMRRMTRDLHQTEIRAPFAGDTFRFRNDRVRLETLGSERFMRLNESLFRVSKVIGGRYREDFVGTEVDPSDPFGRARDVERVLPVSFLSFNGEWRYKGYSVMVKERTALEPGVVWKTGCIFCHNTVPTLSTLLDDVYGARAHTYQGSVSVELPPDKAQRFVVRDESGLKAALDDELRALGSRRTVRDYDTKRALTVSIDATRDQFDESKLVELGIGCEACHGGSREHAESPLSVKPTLALQSPFLSVTTASGAKPTHAENVNRTCAKCHTVLFSRYPYTWEGRTRRNDPGGATINSGEGRDFLLGDCNTQLSCTHCHDPHAEDSKSALAELEGPKGDALCTGCHESMKGASALRAHTHHPAESTGSRCINCHMPKKNMGLAYELTRYHRIGSPTDSARVEGDRPLECALCHTDRSVDQLVATMERFWGKKYDRVKLRALYGPDLRVNALEATLRYGKPHEQGTAVAIAGRDQRADWLPLVVAQFGNDYPLVRFFARHAVERITKAPLPIDMNAPGPEVLSSAQRYLAEHPRTSPPP